MEFYIRDPATRELSDIKLYAGPFIQEFHIEIHELLGKNPRKEICKNLTKIYQNDIADTIRANTAAQMLSFNSVIAHCSFDV